MAERNLTQKEVIKMTGLSSQTVSKLFHNRQSYIAYDTMSVLLRAFEISDMNELLKIEEVV